MPRKKSPLPRIYAIVESAPLNASTVDIAETGTARLGQLLEAIQRGLANFPEARAAVVNEITSTVGANPDTRILP
jgi:hypothetical protein